MTIEEMLRLQYKLLFHEGLGFTEFRNIDFFEGSNVFFTKTQDQFIGYSKKSIELQLKNTENIFVGLNPRKEVKSGDLNNIAYCNLILIDIDPIRPQGEASTNEQHERALDRGYSIVSDIPSSVLVDSGSGAHIYIPIEPIPVNDPKILTEQIKTYHTGLRQKYQQKDLKIDATYDLPRVTRLWGSFNPKSKRICQPLLPPASLGKGHEFTRIKLELPNISTIPQQSNVIAQTPTDVRFTQLVENNNVLKNIMDGKGDYASPSEANFAFVTILAKAQFSTTDIRRLVRTAPYIKDTQKTENQIDQDVERIIDKVKNNGIGSFSMLHGSATYLKGLEGRKFGYLTGFKRLDDKLAGLQSARLYVVAARTNEGKTSFACNIAYNLIKQGISVLYFPTELGYEPLFDKIVAQASNVALRQFQAGNFTTSERERIQKEVDTISKFPFVVSENFALTLDAIQKKAKEICPEVIIIDYIQAMKYEVGGEPREIAAVMRGLKELNEKLNVPIILCSQLNRSAVGAELSLSQLKGSGSIEEFADCVLALSTLSKFDHPRPVDLYILKSRYSEIGHIKLNFYTDIGRFEERGN